MTIDSLVATIARRIAIYPEWWDYCLTLGIDWRDWPESHVKAAVGHFEGQRERLGHLPAARVLLDVVRGLESDSAVPTDPEILAPIYRHEIRTHRTKELILKAHEDPDNIDRHIAEFQGATQDARQMREFGADIDEIFARAVQAHKHGESLRHIPGWEIVTGVVGGLNAGRVGQVLAKTGFGKTTLAMILAQAACEVEPVMYVNMEMSRQDFVEKLILTAGSIRFADFKKDPAQFHQHVADIKAKIQNRKLFYSLGQPMSIAEIFAFARREKQTNGLWLLIVDYDQKIAVETSRELPEWKALQVAVQQLEILAKELGIFVLLLAQEDDEGRVAASKRSSMPATFVLRFFEQEILNAKRYFLQATKNRFGKRHATVEVYYDPERNVCRPLCEVDLSVLAGGDRSTSAAANKFKSAIGGPPGGNRFGSNNSY